LIQQASNPGQFDSESEAPWNKGPAQDTVYHVVRASTMTVSGASQRGKCPGENFPWVNKRVVQPETTCQKTWSMNNLIN